MSTLGGMLRYSANHRSKRSRQSGRLPFKEWKAKMIREGKWNYNYHKKSNMSDDYDLNLCCPNN